ncbi:MAG: DUF4174 domain-containing protein [Anaerolineaceae bacterium]|nr:DUF4174 domain-containing protein [Anaerolineaceae bacterium]MCB9098203.1 DUF4174 domain-containing protein [Anaerolineales bacterium]
MFIPHQIKLISFVLIIILLGLAACAGQPPAPVVVTASPTITPGPTATPLPATPTDTPPPTAVTPSAALPSDAGTVSGDVCYPSTETPPLTIFIENTRNGDLTTLAVDRGQRRYTTDLPAGEYIAYANTIGMGLQGRPVCDSGSGCPFTIEPGQTVTVDLCDWYSPPGVQPAIAGQAGAEVQVKLLQNMYARTGPQLSYPELGLLEAGLVVQAIARSADGQWLQVTHPAFTQTGWLHAPLTQIFGDPSQLPVKDDEMSPQVEGEQFVPAVWQSAANPGLVLFKGEIRDEQGRPVNGYSILLDNGTWSVLSHPTGASRHYPDVVDGQWDVIIDNETDAAGWWTMTVVRYDCPDFEQGFNAQCKQFTSLSETKVVKVVHPDDNIIEANWTCLDHCGDGVYAKPYRKPADDIDDNLLLYAEDRALKSAPSSPAFEHPAMRTLYDSLPETFDGLKTYLAEERPTLLADGQTLSVPSPTGTLWRLDLESGEIEEQTAAPAKEKLTPETLPPTIDDQVIHQRLAETTAWALSHDGQKITYARRFGSPLQQDIYIYNVETQTDTLIGPINGYLVTELRWTADDGLLVIGANNPKLPSGGAIFTMQPEANTLPEILLESDTAYLVDVLPEASGRPSMVGGTIAPEINEQEMEVTPAELELANFRGQNQLLLIFAPDTTDPDYRQQRAWLDELQDKSDSRNLLVYYFFETDPGYVGQKLIPTEVGQTALEKFGVESDQFGLILIDKNGAITLQTDQPTPPADLFDLIDQNKQ